jgi:hypothetical protein
MSTKHIFFSVLFLLTSTFIFGQKVGGDKDANGCIGSAGYTYSTIKKECIRIFEQKIKLEDTNKADAVTTQTCVIFSSDNKKAEIFLGGGSVVLNRKGKKGAYTWVNGDIVLGDDKGYFIKKGADVIYK